MQNFNVICLNTLNTVPCLQDLVLNNPLHSYDGQRYFKMSSAKSYNKDDEKKCLIKKTSVQIRKLSNINYRRKHGMIFLNTGLRKLKNI